MLHPHNLLLINAGPFEKSIAVHRRMKIMFYLCTTMHFISQLRYNPKTRRDEWYYCIKESYCDLTGRVRSRVMQNVGFIDEDHRPEDIRDIKWRIAVPDNVDKDCGVYFLRTNREGVGEKQTWDYYNLVREIKCTNRQLKTDLNLLLIYHQKHNRSNVHLFLGLLAYWVENTIRYRMKLVNGKGKGRPTRARVRMRSASISPHHTGLRSSG